MRQKISSITQRWRLPAACVLCHQYHRGLEALCQPCQGLLVPIEHGCLQCRLPLQDKNSFHCTACVNKKQIFDKVLCHYTFEEPLRTLVHEFKFKEALYLTNFLTKLLLDATLPTDYHPDCLIPVPMHPLRLRKRGFNQAAVLAKSLARQLELPYELFLCEKIMNTTAQVNLDAKKRKHNLRNAFRVKNNSYQHITLVDDLFTTGSTANALAKCLKEQGIQTVDVWCIARTPFNA